MKYFLIFFIAMITSVRSQSIAQNEARIKGLVAQKIEYNKLTEGEYDGYRLKIHFGSDREAAQAVKATFLDLFSDIPVYEKYVQPNFTVLVGDFRTKLEAYEFMKIAQGDFPSSFIVKDKIKPVSFKDETITRAD